MTQLDHADVKYDVLVIDDEMADTLATTFERLNEGNLLLPEGIEPLQGAIFDVRICQNPRDLRGRLDGSPKWDAFIIDKRFNEAPAGKRDWAIWLLQSLHDLNVRGLRIVWTAYADPSEAVQCMRLDAWDYVDKKSPRHGDAFTDVIVSVIEGLRERERDDRKAARDQQAQEWLTANYDSVCDKHEGKFLALEKAASGDEWTIAANDASLFGLYIQLEDAHKDRDELHITLIHA